MGEPLCVLSPVSRLLTGIASILITLAAVAIGLWLEARSQRTSGR